MLPITDLPRHPDGMVDGLGTLLARVVPELATGSGPGSVIFVRERLGDSTMTEDDRSRADALAATCQRHDVRLRGMFASTPRGVHRLR